MECIKVAKNMNVLYCILIK